MIRVLGVFVHLLLFIVLTVLTQIGGIVYLISILVNVKIRKVFSARIVQVVVMLTFFILLYSGTSFLLVPMVAKAFGREPLPWSGDVRPLNRWTCFLNRHYVTPGLKQTIQAAGVSMKRNYPGIVINYLDANFPFWNGFPLLPHLSHNDGRKLDIAFFYMDEKGEAISGAPSFMGYGVYEAPKDSEINMPELCRRKGFWQYSLLEKFVSKKNRYQYQLDEKRTRDLVQLLVQHSKVEKLFIEPHLRKRMKLNFSKIRFHGCQAVRHDDHVHVQVY